MNDFSVQHYAVDGKFMMIVDKLFQEKNKNVQQVLEKLVDLFKKAFGFLDMTPCRPSWKDLKVISGPET